MPKDFSWLSTETEKFIIEMVLGIDLEKEKFKLTNKKFNEFKSKFSTYRIFQKDNRDSCYLEKQIPKTIYYETIFEIDISIFQELLKKEYVIPRNSDIYWIFSNKIYDYFFFKKEYIKKIEKEKIIKYLSSIIVPLVTIIISIFISIFV